MAVEALEQPCARSVSNAQAYLISSPHSAWAFFHLLHLDGCSTVKLSPNGTNALQCPVQSIWKNKQPKTLADKLSFAELKSCIFNKKHFLFKAVGTLCCWQIRLCFPSRCWLSVDLQSCTIFLWMEAEDTTTTEKRKEWGEAQENRDRQKSFSLSHFIITSNPPMGNYQPNFN